MKRFAALALAAVLFVFLACFTGTQRVFASSDGGSLAVTGLLANTVTRDAAGGEAYAYVSNGLRLVCPVPPAGFDPLTAADSELALYGFPPRPQNDPAELENWQREMSFYRGTAVPDISVGVEEASAPAASGEPGTDVGSVYPSNNTTWAGYVDEKSSNYWCGAEGTFVQATNHSTANGSGSGNAESSWVGLGGVNTYSLSQAGTAMNEKDAYDAFFECLNQNYDMIRFFNSPSSIQISPGDTIYTYISYQSSNNLFNYYVADNTTGKAAQGLITPVSDSGGVTFNCYDGSTAEWIDENPNVSPHYLSDFGTVNWSGCEAETNSQTWQAVSASTNYKYDDGLTSVSALAGSGTAFSDTWLKSH